MHLLIAYRYLSFGWLDLSILQTKGKGKGKVDLYSASS